MGCNFKLASPSFLQPMSPTCIELIVKLSSLQRLQQISNPQYFLVLSQVPTPSLLRSALPAGQIPKRENCADWPYARELVTQRLEEI